MIDTSSSDRDQRRRALETYWQQYRDGMIDSRSLVWGRWLNRERVLGSPAAIPTASAMVEQAMLFIVMDEDAIADEMLEAAEAYVHDGIARDEVDGAYRMMGTIEYGRAARFKLLIMIQWLRRRSLDVDGFRRALELERPFKQEFLASDEWHDSDLAECMAEHLLLEEFEQAMQLHERYATTRKGRAKDASSMVLRQVAYCLANRVDASCADAEAGLDRLYHALTNWVGPGFREADLLLTERFLAAYVRAKYFKGETDPIRVLKRMKFSE
jgi:hypothetical protein